MFRKAVILAGIFLMALSLGSAQTNNVQLERGPGMIGAGSPAYGLEIAIDRFALGLGLAKPSGIAQERAAEATRALKNNNTKAAVNAGKQLAKIAKRTEGKKSGEGIEKAMASFQETMNKMEKRIQSAPNQKAKEGMQKALENMRDAYQNMNEAKQKRENARKKRNQTNRQGDSRRQINPNQGQNQSSNPSNTSRTRGQENGNTTERGETGRASQPNNDQTSARRP